MSHTHELAFVFPRNPEQLDAELARVRARADWSSQPAEYVHLQDQVVAGCQEKLAAIGVDVDDPAQRLAFLVGALGGYGSAQRSLQDICSTAGRELAHVAAHWGVYILRIARDGS